MGQAQTTKPHQKGLTTPQLQKGANIPLNPQHLKNVYPMPPTTKGDKHTPKLEKGLTSTLI